MKWRDIQAFIPGWGLVYLHREYKAKERAWDKIEARLDASHQILKRDLRLCEYFYRQMDSAIECGDLLTAQDYSDRITRMSLSYDSKINS